MLYSNVSSYSRVAVWSKQWVNEKIISVIRCSYIGDKPERFFLKILKLRPSKLIFCAFLIGLNLSLIKLFTYEINFINPVYEYPIHESFPLIKHDKFSMIILITILNFLIDFVNGVIFLLREKNFKNQNLKTKKLNSILFKPIWMIFINDY
ncbi:hypothetical protein BpHYR1_025135 [Brachionus plicatilis]|uniref:Uncharacterized protein n=1 Tax=Brachionus plicatilis TaxID=10195 RepID=A0A3M7RRV8_BRAPC|nr:hypothetical protein BpHYR1_025135 [Brachionus plicatilis]